MEFLRYVFLIAILIGSTSIGFLISKGYKNRVLELRCFSNLINILQNKIKFTHKPLCDVLEEVSNIKTNAKISQIFKKTAKNLENQTCEEALDKAITEEKVFLNLNTEDIELIKTLGTVLGKTDIDGQMSEINQFNVLLENQIRKAEQEQLKNEKMYKSLGTIVGLVIVIILI